MKRRQFLSGLVSAGTLHSAVGSRLSALALQAEAAAVKRVLVMFKCHLDVGFTDTQAGVMRYISIIYFPKAMKRAAAMRESGGDRYRWTTGSWLLYEYLEQANSEHRKRMETGYPPQDIAWHALPFSWQTEFIDRSMIAGAIGFSSRSISDSDGRPAGQNDRRSRSHARIIAPLAGKRRQVSAHRR